MPVSAAVYVRISQDRGGEALGVERQEQDCKQLAESLGWTVSQVFTDNNISAYSGKRRPGYEQLLAAVEAGSVDGVLAWHPDRLHRSPRELERYIELIEKHKVVTHTVQSGSWDLSTPSGRAVARTLGAWARYESEHKGERIRRASQQRALAGKPHGGSRPYGYQKGGVELELTEAPVVAEMYEKVLAGVSLRKIVHELNRRGVPTAKGGRWESASVREIIVNPRYSGMRPHKGEPVAKAVWPAIVSESVWSAARAIVTDPARRTSPVGAEVKWLGSGLYYCGVCGGRQIRCSTSGSSRGTEKRKPSYRCKERAYSGTSHHVVRNAELLDEYVEGLLVARLSQADVAPAIAVPGPDIGAMNVEQGAIRARLDELAELFASGAISARQLAKGSESLNDQLAAIGAQMSAAVVSNPLAAVGNTSNISDLWFGSDDRPRLDLGSRRAILDALITVTILPTARRGSAFDYDAIRIEWNE